MTVQIEPWSDADIDLLRRINTPEMKRHLGGPETEVKLLDRHQRYMFTTMYRIVLLPERESVGSIGYWDRVWQDDTVYEMGWNVLPEFQGRGIAATAAEQVIALARDEDRHQYVHAFPSVNNPASNAICRKVGFELIEECDFEYPPGRWMRCNNWRFKL